MSRKLTPVVVALGLVMATGILAAGALAHRTHHPTKREAAVLRVAWKLSRKHYYGSVPKLAATVATVSTGPTVVDPSFSEEALIETGSADTTQLQLTPVDCVEFNVPETASSSDIVTSTCIGKLPAGTKYDTHSSVSTAIEKCGLYNPYYPHQTYQPIANNTNVVIGAGVTTTFSDGLYQATCDYLYHAAI